MNNKVMQKEEIIGLLNDSKLILKNNIIDYLESIINLEFSVVKDNISDEERKALSELQVYRSALIYNIYKRDVLYFNEEYRKNNINFFKFYINSNDIPSIKLLVKISSEDTQNNLVFKEQLEITKNYFYRLIDEYDIKESAMTSGKKFVKKIPGLIIKKEFEFK